MKTWACAPLANLALTTTFPDPEPVAPAPRPVVAPDRVLHTVHLLPQDTTLDELNQVTHLLHPSRSAFTYSAPAAWAIMYAGVQGSTVVVWAPHRWQDDILAWLQDRGICTETRDFGD